MPYQDASTGANRPGHITKEQPATPPRRPASLRGASPPAPHPLVTSLLPQSSHHAGAPRSCFPFLRPTATTFRPRRARWGCWPCPVSAGPGAAGSEWHSGRDHTTTARVVRIRFNRPRRPFLGMGARWRATDVTDRSTMAASPQCGVRGQGAALFRSVRNDHPR